MKVVWDRRELSELQKVADNFNITPDRVRFAMEDVYTGNFSEDVKHIEEHFAEIAVAAKKGAADE